MSIEWICKHHSDLGKEQLYAVLQLRTAVFVVEQRCAYQEVDGQDLSGDTLHLMGWQDDKLVAYLRLLDPQSQGGDVVIGRVVTAADARGGGLGHQLLLKGLECAEHCWAGTPVYLSAQAHLQGYYARHGFVAVGEEYLEDDIPHIGMRKG
ncbi:MULTISPECIES: GNAT family N-acetyltransferase [Pseudomonas]|uniref:GNAT family N-acetyltransferase n=3 Tax=Pseudomonas TaxID=286 RepID=A0ABN5TR54_9PSED|nr:MULTISPECIES: GNAT family N-acetyltransferase [Pseudomonas]AZL70939.1 GNAT family N-acetyltransferase [Pseudomonas oryziphila]AZL75978.1 GNAT family N-acetyltransferase [Pseudomonas oryziphila]MDZ4018668.1 Protein ElaA [Pseudomonas sichuanensis]UVK82683.1 GNAT family N-acetyltransferase [Pseudomonas sichuanensis]UVL88893.1 GNAT family N-acetyltransferase [Pseudomonas sichuanensis]